MIPIAYVAISVTNFITKFRKTHSRRPFVPSVLSREPAKPTDIDEPLCNLTDSLAGMYYEEPPDIVIHVRRMRRIKSQLVSQVKTLTLTICYVFGIQ